MSDSLRKKITRRRVLGVLAGAAAVGAAATLWRARYSEPRDLETTFLSVEIPNLPRAWSGVRLVQFTDLHLLWRPSLDFYEAAVAASNAARPDIAVFTGDYLLGGNPFRILSQLVAAVAAPLGKFAILGNHDFEYGSQRVASLLEAGGATMLTNSHRVLVRQEERLCIAGVDDYWKGLPDLAAALRDAPAGVPRVLLSHNPDFADEVPPDTVDLMLSGHTHGGQICLPLLGPVKYVARPKYTRGLVAGPTCPVYISRGLGMSGPGFRLCCRPELNIITLTTKTGD